MQSIIAAKRKYKIIYSTDTIYNIAALQLNVDRMKVILFHSDIHAYIILCKLNVCMYKLQINN